MPTLGLPALQHVAASGFATLGLVYDRLADGTLYWRGDRPGPGWHAHGLLRVRPRDLLDGRLIRLVVAKQRWKNVDTGRTVHSRPPDDVGRHYTALVVAIALFAWLDAALGLHNHERVHPDLDRIATRTLQRWLRGAKPHGIALQQAVRLALLDRDTPPETLFPRGLPPPDGARRPWRDPGQIWQLHRGLRMALGAAIGLQLPAALLLVEAHRRTPHEPFLIG